MQLIQTTRNQRKEVREVKKGNTDDWKEKTVRVCLTIFFPVLIAWTICALVKILINVGLVT